MDPLATKPRLATVWLGGCSGCHMSFLDLDEQLVDLAGRVQLLASPLTDYKEFPEVDITLVEGAVANEEHLQHIREIRARTKVLISFGDCAVTGNVTALRNVFAVQDVLNCAYQEHATLIQGLPVGNAVVPALLDRVRPVHEVVPVDYFLQGCPPEPAAIFKLVADILDGRPPALDERRFG
jgi:NAD-reducing hydrogenase small subunit